MSITASSYGLSDEEITQQMVTEMEQLVDGLTTQDKKILRRAFRKIDLDGSGKIDAKELRIFLSVKWKQVLPPKTIDSVLALADVDSDGLISFEEFARFQVKYMSLCRGYCADCKKVILGIDGWYCTKCQSQSHKGPQYCFALCVRCFSKPGSTRLRLPYQITDMRRFSIAGIEESKVDDFEEANQVYDSRFLQPLLRRHLRKVEQELDDEDYWQNALRCVMQ